VGAALDERHVSTLVDDMIAVLVFALGQGPVGHLLSVTPVR
jgi:hypothetical protein